MRHLKTIYAILSITLALSYSNISYAANTCKGNAAAICQTNDSCNWIKAHNRKDGAKVKAYCRTKPTKKSKVNAAPAKASATTAKTTTGEKTTKAKKSSSKKSTTSKKTTASTKP